MERGKKIIGESITKNWKQTDCAHLGERFHLEHWGFPFLQPGLAGRGEGEGKHKHAGMFSGMGEGPRSLGRGRGCRDTTGVGSQTKSALFLPREGRGGG